MIDPRYRFIRGERFDGLEDYLNAPELPVKTRDLFFSEQLSFDGINDEYKDNGLRCILGRFFELLAHGIYGGAMHQIHHLKTIDTHKDRSLDTSPDLTHKTHIREVKGLRAGSSLKLLDEQTERYLKMQLSRNGSLLPVRVSYEIFRHGVHSLMDISEKGAKLDNMFALLSDNIKWMMSVPFCIIQRVHAGEGEFIRKYASNKHFDSMSLFNSTPLNYLFAFPEYFLKDIGLNPDDFYFEKRKFPRGVKFNEREITPFPVLIIKEKDLEKTIEIIREYEERRRKLEAEEEQVF